MWKPDICIWHGDCDDGFGAAWAIWRRWPEIEFFAGKYGDAPPAVDGKHVLMVDFSYKRPVIEEMAKVAASIVIIDHHKTAEADLEPFKVEMVNGTPLTPERVDFILDRPAAPKVIAWFDMEQSGAVMAWKFAHGDVVMPTLLEFIQDRDLWRFKYGDDTRKFSAALRTYPMDFEGWTALVLDPGKLIVEGEIVLRAHRANIDKFMKDAYWANVGGYRVPVVNVPYHYASDTAHELLMKHKDAPFAGAWFRRGDGLVQWSLRSEDHRIDVSAVAVKMGGGGHRNTAGFQGL